MNIKDEYKNYFDNVEIRDEFVESLKNEINSETVFMGKYSVTESSERKKFKFNYIIPTAAAVALIFTSALAVFNSNDQYEIDVPVIESDFTDITETTPFEVNSETSEESALTSFDMQTQTNSETENTTTEPDNATTKPDKTTTKPEKTTTKPNNTTTATNKTLTETVHSFYEDKDSSLYTTYKNETSTNKNETSAKITTKKEEILSNTKTSQTPVITTATSQSTQIENHTSVIAGNSGSVVMSSENDTDIEILMFEIKCDSNIKINDVSFYDKVNGKKLTYFFNPEINQCIVSTTQNVGMKVSDIAITIEFYVNEDIQKGDYEFEINVLQCCNKSLKMIQIEDFGSAFITVL